VAEGPDHRQKAPIRPPDLADGVDNSANPAYDPLEPTSPNPVIASPTGHLITVQLEDSTMPSHVNRAEAIGAASAAVGVLVAFLPWYGYTAGTSHITVNAFRASLLGDIFFLAVAATILLLLIGRGFIDDVVTPYVPESTAHAAAAALAMGSVLIQLIVAAATGRSLGVGIVLALLAAAGLCTACVFRRLHPDRRRIVRDSLAQGPLITP
jgi:hypothetical protein